MKSRSKWYWSAVVAAGLVFIYGVLLFALPAAGPRLQVLPDGSTLSIASVSLTTNTTVTVAGVAGWRRRLFPLVPAQVRSRLGWLAGGGSITLGGEPGQTNLVVALVGQLKSRTSLTAPRLQVRDEAGNWFDAVGNQGSMKSFAAAGGVVALEAWSVPMFPRRVRRLGLRVAAQSGAEPQTVAEFTVPNPALRDYPVWRAEPLPNTQRSGDLEVTLRSWRAENGPAAGRQPTFTRAAFALGRTGGGDPGTWAVAALLVSDPTGNLRNAFEFSPLGVERTNLNEIVLPGALWPGESAWKLRVELSPTAGFAPEDVVTLAGLPRPAATNTALLNWTTNLAGGRLKLIALSGEKSTQPGNLNYAMLPGRVNLSVEAALSPGAPARRLRLVAVVDDAGRPVGEIAANADRSGLQAMYGFTPAAEARSLTITFALPASRFVEFLARPEFPARTAKP